MPTSLVKGKGVRPMTIRVHDAGRDASRGEEFTALVLEVLSTAGGGAALVGAITIQRLLPGPLSGDLLAAVAAITMYLCFVSVMVGWAIEAICRLVRAVLLRCGAPEALQGLVGAAAPVLAVAGAMATVLPYMWATSGQPGRAYAVLAPLAIAMAVIAVVVAVAALVVSRRVR